MATTNVIQLPTAAKRKVRQCPSRTKAADWKALAQFPSHKVVKLFSGEILEDARAMMESGKSEAMQIALAVFSLLSSNDRARVIGRLAGLAMLNHAGARGAIAWLNYELSSTSRKRELFAAAEWLQERGEI